MTGQQQAEALRREIWSIANRVRGAVDGWDFKQFVLGALFYRFISENFTNYIEGGDDNINYAGMADADIPDEAKVDAVKTKGYFIYPSQLFQNVVKTASKNDSLNTDLAEIFSAIEASASGYPSEQDINGLFADFDTTSNRLGSTVKQKNERLAEVLKGVAGLPLKFDDNEGDLFGDAYEFLISNYAANAGKSGGEFFTPTHVSKLIAKLAMHKQTSVNKIYDPAAGSGSLLLQAKEEFEKHIIEDGFFGQEINYTTYNLARMNMFLHNINYDKFNIQHGNTLMEPHFGDDKPFDAIVSNPPYSINWKGSDDPTLINDDRFAPAGILAPKSKADFAFVLHALHYLSAKGRAAIVCFPGIFYRGGAEQKIRKYLVDNNFVETVIALAPNLFFGTTIAVNILVLAKNKTDTAVQFIDASGEEFFKKEANTNVMQDDHIAKIMEIFDTKENWPHISEVVRQENVVGKDYNLSVSAYVEPKDTREVANVSKLNEDLKLTVGMIDKRRAAVDAIVGDIEGDSDQGFMERLLKRSEVDWIPLGDEQFFEVANRHRRPVKASLRVAGDTPYYGANNIQDFVQGHTHDGEYVLIAEDGSASLENYSIQYALGKFWANNHVHVIRGKDNVNTRYLYHYLSVFNFIPFLTGGGRAKLTKGRMIEIPVPIPCSKEPDTSLEIQSEIARLLDTFIDLSAGLSEELKSREKQYHHYRGILLNFPKPEGTA